MHEFNPSFVKVTTAYECADIINSYHEDYPQRVYSTYEIINNCLDMNMVSINEFECKGFHSYIMNDLVPQYRGQWRNTYVTIGGYQPCAPWMIQGEIEEANLFPFEFSSIIDESDIIRWYRQFEIIHPFIDGNGRVGGVIAAIASYWFSKGEYLLAPGQ